MGVRHYAKGLSDGLNGRAYYAHRNGRRYDSENARRSYDNGRNEGARLARLEREKR
jgi:hypothetical protein